MIYRISHVTEYQYSEPVTLAHHLAHLSPRDTDNQIFRRHRLDVFPSPAVAHDRIDAFGNRGSVFIVQEPHRCLTVKANSEVEVLPVPAFEPLLSPSWEQVRDGLPEDLSQQGLSVYQYIFDTALVKCSRELAEYAASSFPADRPLLDGVMDLSHRIFSDFVFDPAATTVSTPLSEVLASRRGVCQDFAHLEIGCLRSLGLAARYVSGYIETEPLPGQVKLHGCDASHAWVSVYCPGQGWVDFDPTNDQQVSGQHITLAWGRDFGDVSPLRGVILGGGQHSLSVGVTVTQVPQQFDQAGNSNGNGFQQMSAQQQQQ